MDSNTPSQNIIDYDHKMNSPPSPRFFCTPTNIQEGAAASTISDLLSVQDVNSKLGLMSMITLFCAPLRSTLLAPAKREAGPRWLQGIYNWCQSMQFCSWYLNIPKTCKWFQQRPGQYDLERPNLEFPESTKCGIQIWRKETLMTRNTRKRL